jgi:hypothetical protein
MSVTWLKQNKKRGYERKENKAFITISDKNSNKIYLSSKTMKDLLNNNKYVKIGVDNLKKRMYIKQTTVNDINAMRVRTPSKNSSGVINSTRIARKLVKVAGIAKNDKQRYEIQKLKDGLYYADFTKPMDDMKGEVINDWE